MRVIVEAEVFRADRLSERQGDLLSLFNIGTKGYHFVEVEDPVDRRFTAWLEGESARTRRVCEHALDASRKAYERERPAMTIRIADVETPSWKDLRLPLSTAVDVLRRPLVLLLENARNDRNFLEKLMRLADFKLAKLVADGAVEIRTCGGIDENREWLADGKKCTREERTRLWVMCDSDARRPWRDEAGQPMHHHLSKAARKLREVCAQIGVPLHILERRAIDNYIPLPLLEAWVRDHQPTYRTRYDALASLGDRQRYHYNMKEGFAKDRDDDLYRGLDPEVERALASGFNTRNFKVTDLLDGTMFVREQWLLKDKQEQEALRIAESIREAL
jgi:hypothetical protein